MPKVCGKLSAIALVACILSKRMLIISLFLHIPGPIPVPLFPQHVATLHADGDIGFSKEYEAIQSVSFQGELNSEHSMNDDNKNKNRYLNIVACKLYSPHIVVRFFFRPFVFNFIIGNSFCSQTITPGFNWGLCQARKSQRIISTPITSMASSNAEVTLEHKDRYRPLLTLSGEWFGNRG